MKVTLSDIEAGLTFYDPVIPEWTIWWDGNQFNIHTGPTNTVVKADHFHIKELYKAIIRGTARLVVKE